MLHDALDLRRPGGDPLAQDRGTHRRPRARSATACTPARSARRRRRLPHRRRQDARPRARPPPTILAAEGIEATVWDPRVVKPLDPDLLADAAALDRLVVTVEDGLREGGIGATIADAGGRPRRSARGRTHRVAVLGVPPPSTSPTASPTPSSPTSASTPPASPPRCAAASPRWADHPFQHPAPYATEPREQPHGRFPGSSPLSPPDGVQHSIGSDIRHVEDGLTQRSAERQ